VLVLCASAGSVPLGAADPVFTDATAASNLIAVTAPALTFRFSPLTTAPFLGAGAVGDFDNDGWQDFYVVTGGIGPDHLFMNDRDGTFTDRAAIAGIAEPHHGMAAAVGDYDGDGWLDIFVASYGPAALFPQPGRHRLWQNQGDGTFIDRAAVAGVAFSNPSFPDGFGAAFGDIDLDGDLDLFVPHWLAWTGNTLFRNEGNGTFTDVTVAAGVFDIATRSFSAAFCDMDGDRYPELLVTGDYDTSRYYVNDGDGTFTDSTALSGTGLDDNAMGHAIGDLDDDGALDWYVTSIHSVATPLPQVPGTGNMLYRGLGGHAYQEIAAAAGVNDGGWGWGTVAVDANHDGRLDLVETNGFDSAGEWFGELSRLFSNDGTVPLHFTDVALSAGFDHDGDGRGLLHFDADNDGDQDLVVIGYQEPLAFYRNESTSLPDRHWLRVLLDTRQVPSLAPHGFGTRVIATAGGTSRARVLHGGSGYNGTSELSVHFGLGSATVIDELRIEWADGTETVIDGVSADQTLTVAAGVSGEFVRADCNHDALFDLADPIFLLVTLFAGTSAPHLACPSACDGDDSGALDIADGIALLGALFGASRGIPSPHPGCGPDPSPDLPCTAYLLCP